MVNFREALNRANAAKETEQPTEQPTKQPSEFVASEPAGQASWLQPKNMEEGLPERPAKSRENFVPRLWLKTNSQKQVLFLSPGQPIYPTKEHQVKVGKRWQNWATCLQVVGKKCPLCEVAVEVSMFYAYDAAHFSLIDIEGYTKKDGTKVEMVKTLLCAKSSTLSLLKHRYSQRAKKGETLRGAIFDVFRSNDGKSPAVGDMWDFNSMYDLSQIEDQSLTEEFDLRTILKPNEELCESLAAQVRAERGEMPSSQVAY